MAAEIGYLLLFLTMWFIIPFALGTLFFRILKKRWKALAKDKGAARVINYIVFLLCALAGWFAEMLVLTGVKMIVG
jgi:hypothetical protein